LTQRKYLPARYVKRFRQSAADTDKVENLRLIKRVGNLFADETNSGEFSAKDIDIQLHEV